MLVPKTMQEQVGCEACSSVSHTQASHNTYSVAVGNLDLCSFRCCCMPVLLLELMIPPTTGWVAQWQSVPHVWGSPGFDPRSGLFFLFLQLLVISHWTRLHPLASGDALALFIHSFHGLGTMCPDSSNSSNIVVLANHSTSPPQLSHQVHALAYVQLSALQAQRVNLAISHMISQQRSLVTIVSTFDG